MTPTRIIAHLFPKPLGYLPRIITGLAWRHGGPEWSCRTCTRENRWTHYSGPLSLVLRARRNHLRTWHR